MNKKRGRPKKNIVKDKTPKREIAFMKDGKIKGVVFTPNRFKKHES